MTIHDQLRALDAQIERIDEAQSLSPTVDPGRPDEHVREAEDHLAAAFTAYTIARTLLERRLIFAHYIPDDTAPEMRRTVETISLLDLRERHRADPHGLATARRCAVGDDLSFDGTFYRRVS